MRRLIALLMCAIGLSAMPSCQVVAGIDDRSIFAPGGVMVEGACTCTTCWAVKFCQRANGSTYPFPTTGCLAGEITAQPVDIAPRDGIPDGWCIPPASGVVDVKSDTCPGNVAAPSASVLPCSDVPQECRDPNNQLFGSCAPNVGPPGGATGCHEEHLGAVYSGVPSACGATNAGSSIKTGAEYATAITTGTLNAELKLHDLCREIRGQDIPVTAAGDVCYAQCFINEMCQPPSTSNFCSIDCDPAQDPPFVPQGAVTLVAGGTSQATMNVVLIDADGSYQEAGTTQSYGGMTAIAGQLVFELSKDCVGPLAPTQSATCSSAAITSIMLDGTGSFSIAGKNASNMRVLLEQPALVQGKTTGDMTELMLVPNAIFGISTDLQDFGRVGNNFFTDGSPLVIVVDWTKKMFALKGTIQNQQQNASVTLDVEGTVTNQPPRADAGPNQVLECTSPSGTPASLSGAASTDPDGSSDLASYTWDWQLGGVAHQASGSSLSLLLPLGTVSFALDVRDKEGASDGASANVTVHDTTPPVLTLGTPMPSCLWPPNHKVVLYELGNDLPYTVSDICDASPKVQITNVTSSESGPEFAFGKSALCLQAERLGSSTVDEQFTITITATDSSNNTTVTTEVVRVPHDQSHDCRNVDHSRIVDITDPRCTQN
jgi:hypothetical protein